MRWLQHILLSIALCSAANAQASKDKKDTYQVYLNYPDQSIKANVLAEPASISPEVDRTYYWYAFNKIMLTKGGFDGKLLHGNYAAFYLNSNLREKGTFRKGLKQGKWITWYENGSIKDITYYKNGARTGVYRSFDPEGNPVLEARFRNDELHGTMKTYENGKLLSTKKYRNNEEVIKRPKEVKEKKARAGKSETVPTKEGVNTVTPQEPAKEKRSFFSKKKKNSEGENTGKPAKPAKKKNQEPKADQPPKDAGSTEKTSPSKKTKKNKKQSEESE